MTAARAMPVVALGDPGDVSGLAVAGVQVWAATTSDEVRGQWSRLPAPAVVLLTPAAARALAEVPPARGAPGRLTVVLPS